MLIVFASAAVLGVTVFIVQRLSQQNVDETSARCLYLAKAGIHNAAYFYRFNDLSGAGHFSLGQTNVDVNKFFVLGGNDADFLMVNTSTAAIGGAGNRDLLNLTIQNANDTRAIAIDRMIVTWNNTRNLQAIRIAGSDLWSGPAAGSPVNANLVPNFSLNTTPAISAIDRLRFSGNMNTVGLTITIQFLMTDGSSRTVRVYPASQQYNFTVKSTGKTAGSNIYRTVQADYNALAGNFTHYNEISTEIIP